MEFVRRILWEQEVSENINNGLGEEGVHGQHFWIQYGKKAHVGFKTYKDAKKTLQKLLLWNNNQGNFEQGDKNAGHFQAGTVLIPNRVTGLFQTSGSRVTGPFQTSGTSLFKYTCVR